jgi:hypothetical protein
MKIDKKTIIAIVLGVAALGVVLYQMRGMFMPNRPAPTKVAAAAQQPTLPSSSAAASKQASTGPSGGKNNDVMSIMADGYAGYIAGLEEASIDFSSKRFKNPMTPIVKEGDSERPQSWGPAQVTEVPDLLPGVAQLSQDDTIEGIVWNDAEPLALVNDQVVGVGEELEDGAVVTSITQDTVKFSRNGKRYYLVLREE